MADRVLDFLRQRLPPEELEELDAPVKLRFVPSLVLAAYEDPEQLHCILGGVEEHRSVARSLAYASLDYHEIESNAKRTLESLEDVKMLDVDEWFEPEEKPVKPDECLLFERADEKGRVELALVSLRKGDDRSTQRDAGSIWNNATYLSELGLLLPIALSRCPTLLTPELLVNALLLTSCGVQLLVSAVANNPNLMERVALLLVEVVKAELAECSAEPSNSRLPSRAKLTPQVEAAAWTLFKLCLVAQSFAFTCRDILVEAMVLEEMVLLVTLEVLHDELEFLSGTLFKNQKSSKWFVSYLSSGQRSMFTFPAFVDEEGGLSKLSGRTIDRHWVIQELRKALLKDAKRTRQEKGWCARLYAHMKVCCVLLRNVVSQPTFEEIDFWLKTVVYDKARGPGPSQRVLELGISFLCLVPGLSSSATKASYHGCVAYLLSPAKQATGFSTTVELALWLAVQLLARHSSNIAEFIRESLGVHVTVQSALMLDLADSAVAAGITSDPSMLANAVVALRPTGALAENLKHNMRTLMCLEQLLHPSLYTRCGVDIWEPLSHMILLADEPVPQKLVCLIQTYVDFNVQQASTKAPLFRSHEVEQFIIQAVSPAISHLAELHRQGAGRGSSVFATASLATYLLLCREHMLRSLRFEEEKSWSQLVSIMPLKPFLTYMENHTLKYEHLLPSWFGLAAALFPEKFRGPSRSARAKTEDTDWLAASENECLSTSNIQVASRKALAEPVLIVRILQGMRKRAASYSWNLADVIGNANYWSSESVLIKELVPVLLDPKCSFMVQSKFCAWWSSLPQAAMEHLIVVFFKTVRMSSVSTTEFLKDEDSLDYSSLVRDPLLFLSCDPRLFYTPLLDLFLDTMVEILTVNRRICEAAVLESGKEGGLRREEVAAALTLQDSAVCQILLERCLLKEKNADSINLVVDTQAVCRTLSGLFHANGLLLKLLHFQGYNVQLLPIMVQHVPCMIQCFDFLEELIQQPQQKMQIFAVHLASRLTARYPEATKSLLVAEKIVAHVIHMQTNVAGCVSFLQQVLQPVSEIVLTFPVLVAKVIPLLQTCAQAGGSLKTNGPPRDAKLEASATTAFRTLVRRKVIYGQVTLDESSSK